MGPQWDIVVANILADVIIEMAYDFSGWIRQGSGIFIASGIIDTRELDVIRAAEAAGLVLEDTRHQGEWVVLIFNRPGFKRQAVQ